MRRGATWGVASLVLAARCGLGQLVSGQGDPHRNDGNCPSGRSCCDGKCLAKCTTIDVEDAPRVATNAALTVSVVSDLAPLVDFDTLIAALEDGSEYAYPLTVAQHFDQARPVAVFTSLREGLWVARIGLTKGAAVVMERRVRMSVRNDTDVTIVLTRACTLMSCPAAGGAADAIVCHNGQCVTTACGALDPGDGDAPNDTPCSGFFTCCNGVGNGCPPRVGGDGG